MHLIIIPTAQFPYLFFVLTAAHVIFSLLLVRVLTVDYVFKKLYARPRYIR